MDFHGGAESRDPRFDIAGRQSARDGHDAGTDPCGPCSWTSQRPRLPYFLSCPCIDLDLGRGDGARGYRRLCIGRGKSYARSARRWARQLLDRFRAELSEYDGRQESGQPSDGMDFCGPHYRWPSARYTDNCSPPRARGSLGRLTPTAAPDSGRPMEAVALFAPLATKKTSF